MSNFVVQQLIMQNIRHNDVTPTIQSYSERNNNNDLLKHNINNSNRNSNNDISNNKKRLIMNNHDIGNETDIDSTTSSSGSGINDDDYFYEENEVRNISLILNESERRFGISVVGGRDEFISPEIENIVAGSSADKTDLQIGDEILEINGESVDNFDHAQIISHIHNCIKDRKITLKIRRTIKTNELSINENIKEAFIIGVDEQAKQRLNKLTKANKVTPIDLQELSTQLSTEDEHEQQQQQQQSLLSDLNNNSNNNDHKLEEEEDDDDDQEEFICDSYLNRSKLNQSHNLLDRKQVIKEEDEEEGELSDIDINSDIIEQVKIELNESSSTNTSQFEQDIVKGKIISNQEDDDYPTLTLFRDYYINANQDQLKQQQQQEFEEKQYNTEEFLNDSINSVVSDIHLNENENEKMVKQIDTNTYHGGDDITNKASSQLIQIKNKLIHTYSNASSTTNGSTNKRKAPLAPHLTPPPPLPLQPSLQQQQQHKSTFITTTTTNTSSKQHLNSSTSSGSSFASSSTPSSPVTLTQQQQLQQQEPKIELDQSDVQQQYADVVNEYEHREMAIDCPDSFVATIKTRPIYPPPPGGLTTFQTQLSTSSSNTISSHNGTDTFKSIKKSTFNKPLQYETPKTPSPPVSIKYNTRENNIDIDDDDNTSQSTPKQITITTSTKQAKLVQQFSSNTSSSASSTPVLATANNNNNKKNEETAQIATSASKKLIEKQKTTQQEQQLRKLKDDEEIILRNSLRNSEKLKNLKSTKTTTTTIRATSTTTEQIIIKQHANGNVNNGYIDDDDDDDYGDRNSLTNDDSAHEDSTDDDHKFRVKTESIRVKIDKKIDTIDSGNDCNDQSSTDDNVQLVKTIDIGGLFQQIDDIQEKLFASDTDSSNDIVLLRKLYQTSEFQNALILYNKLTNMHKTKRIKPICDNSYDTAQEIMKLIENARHQLNNMVSTSNNSDATELCLLLSKLNVNNILQTHDQIALNYDLKYPSVIDHNEIEPLNDDLNDDSALLLAKAQHYCVENLKLVNIDKTDTPLGATIRNQDGSIVIGRIVKGGAAELSGLLHEEDEILEINSIPIRGKTINDVSDMLRNTQGTVSFLIIPNMEHDVTKTPSKKQPVIVHIRALFNYEPEEDLYIPCKELGLHFLKGDVLHVISREDADWWQAYRDDDPTTLTQQKHQRSLAGLIPSQEFQEKRFSQMQALIGDSFMDRHGKQKKNGLCMRGAKSKRRKMFEQMTQEIVTYEEVVLYKPPTDRKRPIVLIGPHSIGRHELRKRLMQPNPLLYEVAVPHTTRTPRRDEVDGKDYHFIARHIFEVDIKQGRFIEHGEYEKNLYGTSRDAIKKVIDNSKICVLNLYPQALKTLRNSDLMPYVIYIGPPNLAKLKELKLNSNESYKENDLLDIIDKGREIEELYGHYFDKIIRNTDMDRTYQELVDTIHKVQNEENWVPSVWLKR